MSQDFFASSLRALHERIRIFHAKLAKDAKEDAKKGVPEMSVSREARENHLLARAVSTSARHVPEI